MKQRILIPITFSDVSKDVIRLADKWAQKMDAEPVFLHICPERSLANTYTDEYFDQTELDRKRMGEFVREQGLLSEYQLLFRTGTTYLNIIEEEKSVDPAMILMPSHSHTLLSRIFLGSNTDYVVHHSTSPIYVYKKTAQTWNNIIIVPLDFTEVNRDVATMADEWAQEDGSELHFIHVGTLPEFHSFNMEYEWEIGKEMIEDHSRQLDQQLADFIGSLRVKSKYVKTLEFGKPYHHICNLQLGLKAKLIMMASHSHTILDRLISGSNTDYVLHHVECPVYVYKKKENEE